MTRPSANAPMINSHPITPPPEELVQKWVDQLRYLHDRVVFSEIAQWGADQELDACCEVLRQKGYLCSDSMLRGARRLEPQTQKEQGLKSLDELDKCLKMLVPGATVDSVHIENIRRALEALPE